MRVNGETIPYDRVLSTTSPKLMLRLAPQLGNTHYGDSMADLRSIGGLCVVVALKHQLLTDGTYWLNLPATSPDKNKSRFPFLALVEHTNWMDKAHYGGDHIIYCGDYVAAESRVFPHQRGCAGRALHRRRCRPSTATSRRVDSQNVGLPRALRPARALPQPEPAHPVTGNAAARRLLGEHEPGLPLGSRDELLGRDGAARRRDDDRLMIVERATEDNLADVIAVDAAHRARRAPHYLTEAVRRHECYIAREGWDVIGFAVLTRSFFEQYFVELLVVHPDQRRKGAATALMQHIEKIVPAEKLFTSTNQSNTPMQALCEKLGFVKSGWIDNLDEGDPEIIYFKR